jgi:hypothetical protein
MFRFPLENHLLMSDQLSVCVRSGIQLMTVNFPSVRPAASTPFTIYRKDGSSTAEEFSKQSTMIAGETADVEYFSVNQDGAQDYQCQ